MKLGQALKIRELFLSLSKEKVNINTAYKMFRFVKKIETENLAFYMEHIREICDKYGEKLPDGQVRVTEESRDAFNAAVQELENIEIPSLEIDFTMNEFSGVKLSLTDFIVLENILKEGNENGE